MPTFEKQLISGWQAVSFPYKVASTSVPSVLSPLVPGTDFDILQWYDPTKPGYRQYASFKPPPLNDLTNLQFIHGFLIHTLQPCTLSITGELVTEGIPLKVGSNQVGFPYAANPIAGYNVADAKADTGCSAVRSGDGVTELPDDYVFTQGEAYFLTDIDEDKTWNGWMVLYITQGELDTLNGYITTALAQPWEHVSNQPPGEQLAPKSSDWDEVNGYISDLGVAYGFDPDTKTIDLETGEVINKW